MGALGIQAFSFSLGKPQYQAYPQPVIALEGASWDYLLSSWAGDLERLSPGAQQALLASVPEAHNALFDGTRSLSGSCADYCSQLAHLLYRDGVEVRMIGGLYFDDIHPGTTIADLEQQVEDGEEDDEIFDWGSHTWLEIEGRLVDPTAGQFFEYEPPGEWQYGFYLPSQMKMHSFLEGWGKGGMPLNNRVIYRSDGTRTQN